jgi:hypothetical protein
LKITVLVEEDESMSNEAPAPSRKSSSKLNVGGTKEIGSLLEVDKQSVEMKKASSMRIKEDDKKTNLAERDQLIIGVTSDEENLKNLTEKANKSMLNFTKYMEGEEAKISKNVSLQSSNLGKPKQARPTPPSLNANKGSGNLSK